MIKVEVIKEFTLKDFDKLKNIKRKMVEKEGKLYIGDTFECDEKMYDYLTGKNDSGAVVVKVVELMPIKEESDNVINKASADVLANEMKKVIKKSNKKTSKK